MKKKRLLILESGHVWEGEAFGGDHYEVGEIVFNTSMTGYQEIISDLSYCGQIVVMSYPMVGNYGMNGEDFESIHPAIFGFVVGEHCERVSHYRSTWTLDEYLAAKGIPGISGIDTRELIKVIRTLGVMKAVMADEGSDVEAIVEMLKTYKMPTNQVEMVSTKKVFQIPNHGEHVVLMDFGVKSGIIRELSQRHMKVTVVPYNTSAKEILAFQPDGVLLSNGPGDPKDLPEVIQTIQELMGKVPIFGICLGHQLIALACGGDTMKLTFGHRGGNHPVLNIVNNQVEITSQNHSYAVDTESLEGTGLQVTHKALHDESVEGLAHSKYPIYSVQYHPEASCGPMDANGLFDEWQKIMKQIKEDNENGKKK
ncbi:MAG: carbamoyl phosphate synthase small subunit [Erysipelotrichaceae bacterium]|nr:carbamoyl phosphate synthase small subunit [Erysipelotrichaceae bacterium]